MENAEKQLAACVLSHFVIKVEKRIKEVELITSLENKNKEV